MFSLSFVRVPVALASALFCAFVLFTSSAFALEVPKLGGRVNDYADLLPADVEQRLTQSLEAYEQKTGQQFVVLTIDSLAGDPIEDFSIRTVEAWKLGTKKEDNGLLLLVSKGDKKARVEVGYGLEGDIPDAFAARVVRNVMLPDFRRGDYPAGIERALAALMTAGAGGKAELPPDPKRGRAPPNQLPWWAVLLFFLAVPFIVLSMAARAGGNALGRMGRRGRDYGGGFLGGSLGGLGGGGFGGRGGGGFGGGGGFSGGGGGFGGGGASGSW
jgi:uncharacterized protein